MGSGATIAESIMVIVYLVNHGPMPMRSAFHAVCWRVRAICEEINMNVTGPLSEARTMLPERSSWP